MDSSEDKSEFRQPGDVLRPRELRNLIRVTLPLDSDFDAFCFDSFPEIYMHFSEGMDRVSKETLLLQYSSSDPDNLYESLIELQEDNSFSLPGPLTKEKFQRRSPGRRLLGKLEWMLVGIGLLKLIDTFLSVVTKISATKLSFTAAITGITAVFAIPISLIIIHNQPTPPRHDDTSNQKPREAKRARSPDSMSKVEPAILSEASYEREPRPYFLTLRRRAKMQTSAQVKSAVARRTSVKDFEDMAPAANPARDRTIVQSAIAQKSPIMPIFHKNEVVASNSNNELVSNSPHTDAPSSRHIDPCIRSVDVYGASTGQFKNDIEKNTRTKIEASFPRSRRESAKCSNSHDAIDISVHLETNPQMNHVTCRITAYYRQSRQSRASVYQAEDVPHDFIRYPLDTYGDGDYWIACERSSVGIIEKLSHLWYKGE